MNTKKWLIRMGMIIAFIFATIAMTGCVLVTGDDAKLKDLISADGAELEVGKKKVSTEEVPTPDSTE